MEKRKVAVPAGKEGNGRLVSILEECEESDLFSPAPPVPLPPLLFFFCCRNRRRRRRPQYILGAMRQRGEETETGRSGWKTQKERQ